MHFLTNLNRIPRQLAVSLEIIDQIWSSQLHVGHKPDPNQQHNNRENYTHTLMCE